MADKTGPGSDEPFNYTLPDGTEVELPSFSKIFRDAGEMRRNRHRAANDLFFWVMERDLEKVQLKAVDKLSIEELKEFTEAWADHSGISEGE